MSNTDTMTNFNMKTMSRKYASSGYSCRMPRVGLVMSYAALPRLKPICKHTWSTYIASASEHWQPFSKAKIMCAGSTTFFIWLK